MKLGEVLQKTQSFFKEKGLDSPRLDAEILLSHALGLKRIDLYLKFDSPLSQMEMESCRDLVRRRATGEPVAYILGKKDFFGREFAVGPAVLIPRPETEGLVDLALQELSANETSKIFDLGTGSGCVGLTLLCELEQAQVVAVDISKDALAVAGQNAMGLEVSDRFILHHGSVSDLLQSTPEWRGTADVVVANPPYIAEEDSNLQDSVRKFEPAEALFAGNKGLACIEDWAQVARDLLKSEGVALFEIGANQGAQAKKIFVDLGYVDVSVHQDLAGLDRIVRAVKRGAS